MIYRVRTLRRARQDLTAILNWIAKERKAPRGATALLESYDQAVKSLTAWPDSYSLAPEDEYDEERELRQFFFKTRSGHPYRGIFTIQGDEILILRIRGPSQDELEPEDL